MNVHYDSSRSWESHCVQQGTIQLTIGKRTWASKLLSQGRVVAECNPFLSTVDVQINKKQSFETDVAVSYAFVLPNTCTCQGQPPDLHVAASALTISWEGGRENFNKMLAVFLQQQEIAFRQVDITFDISLLSLACPVLSVMMASPEWCSQGAGHSQMCH